MSGKKVTFGTRPQRTEQEAPLDPEQWIENRTAPEENQRMTFDVPKSLHRRVKLECVRRGVTIREVVLELLEKEFPA